MKSHGLPTPCGLAMTNMTTVTKPALATGKQIVAPLLSSATIHAFRKISCFSSSADEFMALRSQTVTSHIGRGGRRTEPYVFTAQGVTMLSSVLGSPRAIGVNIEIPRTFVRLRELAATPSELSLSTITAGLINVGLLIVLISFIGLIGAAIAFATSMAIKFLLTCYVTQLRQTMPWFDSRSSV